VEADSSLFVWQTFNALFILRVSVKFFFERLKEDDVYRQFCAGPGGSASTPSSPREGGAAETESAVASTASGDGDPGARMELFLSALISIVADLPATPVTYGLQCEAVLTLLAMLSPPVFSPLRPAEQIKPFRFAMADSNASGLVKALLEAHVSKTKAPATYVSEEGGSLVFGIASGVWNILTLGYGNSGPADVSSAAGPEEHISPTPMADCSLLLLLVLTNHCTDSANPYRDALFRCSNLLSQKESQVDEKTGTEEPSGESDGPSFRTDFGQLFRSLCETLSSDASTLLLYLLLHRNPDFRTHVLASSEVEKVRGQSGSILANLVSLLDRHAHSSHALSRAREQQSPHLHVVDRPPDFERGRPLQRQRTRRGSEERRLVHGETAAGYIPRRTPHTGRHQNHTVQYAQDESELMNEVVKC